MFDFSDFPQQNHSAAEDTFLVSCMTTVFKSLMEALSFTVACHRNGWLALGEQPRVGAAITVMAERFVADNFVDDRNTAKLAEWDGALVGEGRFGSWRDFLDKAPKTEVPGDKDLATDWQEKLTGFRGIFGGYENYEVLKQAMATFLDSPMEDHNALIRLHDVFFAEVERLFNGVSAQIIETRLDALEKNSPSPEALETKLKDLEELYGALAQRCKSHFSDQLLLYNLLEFTLLENEKIHFLREDVDTLVDFSEEVASSQEKLPEIRKRLDAQQALLRQKKIQNCRAQIEAFYAEAKTDLEDKARQLSEAKEADDTAFDDLLRLSTKTDKQREKFFKKVACLKSERETF